MNLTSSLEFAAAVAAVAFVAVLLLRARWSLADTMLVAAMVFLGAEGTAAAVAAHATTFDRALRYQSWRHAALALEMSCWIGFSLTYARVNARHFIRRWRWSLAGFAAALCGLAAAGHGFFQSAAPPPEDAGPHAILLRWPGVAFHALALVAAVVVLMQLERTFRASVGTMRWRIKFMLLGVGLLAVTQMYASSQALVFRGLDPRLDTVKAAAAIIGVLLMLRSLFRGTHLDSAVYPSQVMLERSATLALSGAYLVLIGLLANVAAHWGGGSAFAVKALVVLVALVVLALMLQSDRLRLQIRRFISRHFERPLYDYRAVWRKFNDVTATRVDRVDLCRSIVRLIADIADALSVAIWIFNEEKDGLVLAASTVISDAKATSLAPTAEETKAIVGHLRTRAEPLEFEGDSGDWASALRRLHPRQFPNGGDRVCVPLIDRNGFLGVLIIGDRVSGIRYSVQDLELVQCAADHVAASLRSVEFSQKLLQARELQAFQTMATFFIHDLKNAAWTLDLMLKNLPVHFDNPEFRADALRAISKTANHINHITSRLGVLRHELKIQAAPRDLNAVIDSALTGLHQAKPGAIIRDLRPLPTVLVDQEQFQKVIVNLVLNSIEASPEGGQVRVSTSQTNGSVVLSVSDQGCGMTDEFIRHSLFRPFQTTKKHGLGIGMFQSRMIVEAHGGRIQASSQPGRGTTFQISIPASSKTE